LAGVNKSGSNLGIPADVGIGGGGGIGITAVGSRGAGEASASASQPEKEKQRKEFVEHLTTYRDMTIDGNDMFRQYIFPVGNADPS
jgi:hypothetical protein